MVPIASRLLMGASLITACALATSAAHAQANPFVPSSGASKSQIERIVDDRIRQAEERITAKAKASAATPTPGAVGAPGKPGAVAGGVGVPGGPLTPGAGVAAPGSIAPYGAPGGTDAWSSKVAQEYGISPDMVRSVVPGMDSPVYIQQASGRVRFLGCINGVPKFVDRKSGQRITFTAKEINEAVKSGALPGCR